MSDSRPPETSETAEERYRISFQFADIGIAHIDPQGILIDVNQCFCEILGWSATEILGHSFAEITHAETLQADLKAFQAILAGKRDSYSTEKRYLRKDRTWAHVSLNSRLVRGPEGQPRFFISMIQDISHQKETDAKLKSLTENVPGVVYQFARSPDGRMDFTYLSHSAENLYEVPYASIPRDFDFEKNRLHPEDRESFKSALLESAHELKPFRWRGRILVSSDERIKWVYLASNPRRDDSGTVFWDGVMVDVTQQKETEIRLAESNRQLMESQKIAHVGSWERDLLSDKVEWSPELYSIMGKKPGEAAPSAPLFISMVHPADRLRVGGMIKRAITEHRPYEMQFRLLREDGSVRYLLSRAAVTLNREGKPARLFGTAQDITDMVLAQQQLEATRARALAASNFSALGEMAAGIAHEINNPLTIIHGRAGQIATQADAQKIDAGFVRSAALKIEATSLRISRIIKALRSLSRNAEQDPLEESSIRQILEDTLEFCRQRFLNHDIELTTDLPKEDVRIQCRPVQISQVLLNLLNNAFDAVENLPQRWVRISLRVTQDHLELRVANNGPSIPREIQEKIFLPFFTTKEVGKGTGLGLSLSRAIIESHQGTLSLEDSEAMPCFVVSLPLKRKD